MTAVPSISAADSIRTAMARINASGRGACVVVDDESHLVGIITDGDVRRAILEGIELDGPVSWLLTSKAGSFPLVAPIGTQPATLLAMMRDRGVRQIPLIDSDGCVAGLATLDELAAVPDSPVHAVIMAAGLGTRLRPLTDSTPKPMLPIGGRPLLERTVERLREAGLRRVWMAVHYLPEVIVEHFGNGEGFGVDVHYLLESELLGTAGSLAAVDSDGPVLVVNGDLLTDVDFRAMLAYHQEQGADMTVAVRRIAWHVPFGVVDCESGRVWEIVEKPAAGLLINAGIYLVEPYVRRAIPVRRVNMTEVIGALLAMGRPVAAFPLSDAELWVDIGTPESYARAEEEAT